MCQTERFVLPQANSGVVTVNRCKAVPEYGCVPPHGRLQGISDITKKMSGVSGCYHAMLRAQDDDGGGEVEDASIQLQSPKQVCLNLLVTAKQAPHCRALWRLRVILVLQALLLACIIPGVPSPSLCVYAAT